MMTPIIFYINYKSIILIYIRKMSAIGWKEMRLGEGVEQYKICGGQGMANCLKMSSFIAIKFWLLLTKN